jgi:cephalosporin-C deacetylase-like acetyl esterase
LDLKQLHLLQTPPPLCDFEQWIDTEIKEADMRLLQGLKKWDAERLEILEHLQQYYLKQTLYFFV